MRESWGDGWGPPSIYIYVTSKVLQVADPIIVSQPQMTKYQPSLVNMVHHKMAAGQTDLYQYHQFQRSPTGHTTNITASPHNIL